MNVKRRAPSGLFEAMSQNTDKQEWVNWLFSDIAPRYDLGNQMMSMGWHTRWKQRLLDYARPEPDHRVLDLCCGTGDVTWMLAQRCHRGEVIGADINAEMMAEAEPKRPEGVDNVRFVQTDAADLPFEDQSFDRVFCSYGGRSFPDFPAVLREIHRVLKPGGEYWNLDFGRPEPRWLDTGYRAYLHATGAVFGTVLHGDPKTYMFIPASMEGYPGQRWLEQQMRLAGFEARHIDTTGGFMGFNQGIKR